MDMENVVIASNLMKEEQLEDKRSAEIIAKEVSPKHNVEEIKEKKGKKEMKSVEIEKFYPKPVGEIEEEEMESIDIHEEEDKTVSVDSERLDGDEDEDDEDDTESSVDSKDEDDETTKDCEERVDDGSSSHQTLQDSDSSSSIWTDKAVAIKNFVSAKSEVAVHTFMRRVSGKMNVDNAVQDNRDYEVKLVESSKTEGKSSIWNPLSYLKMMQNEDDSVNKEEEVVALEPVLMKGRIVMYTRLECEECRDCRLFLRGKRLRYVEINIDIYPTRKMELEKIGGGEVFPQVFFNERLVGSMKELKKLEESGKLDEKINYLIDEAPSKEAPLPPFSGEDDAQSKGPIDELALIVRKMKPWIVKDRFYRMRRFKNCFLGSEAVDFLSADQHLERAAAVQVARKLGRELFFQHVLEENVFEDGNHVYRFMDDDPLVSSQCHNIPRGITELKPRPIVEIALRLRLLYQAILEAYTSPDGKHVDYRSIHGSEEFARYLRIIQELQRVEQLEDTQREEKLAFFINLYNMMAIHAILVWGHPTGPLDRTKMFGEFKYVIGGCTYSLSAIQNGILRSNQRPPYNLMKPFGAKDKRLKVALPYAEPLTHFALVCGTRSAPPLRCFTPEEIDKELMEATRNFLRGGGLRVDLTGKVAYISKIFNWYGVDFGKSEEEVLKHASTFLEPQLSEAVLDLLVDTQIKIIYQSYDWGLNN